MNAAKNATPHCTHGVALFLYKGHSCFECEKLAVSQGLPIDARQIDMANAILAHRHNADQAKAQPAPRVCAHAQGWHNFEPLGMRQCAACGYSEPMPTVRTAPLPPDLDIKGTPWTGEAVRRLIDDLRAPRDINGDPLEACPHEAEGKALAAELKALQRVVIDMRRELGEVGADRDAFAKENFELVRTVDALRSDLKRIARIATPITYK